MFVIVLTRAINYFNHALTR